MTSTVLRLPSILWPFTINMDENTFLIVAQRTLHGELPYTTTFENKSPLAMGLESLALLLVGPNPHALRVIAALLVGVAAFAVVLVAPGIRVPVSAYLHGLLFIVLWGTLADGLAWMTELNVVLVFAFALILVIRSRPNRWWQVMITGLVVGVLPLVRVNWAVVAACLAVGFAVRTRSWRVFTVFLLGAVLPTIVTVAAYALNGALDSLWAGAVTLPRMLSVYDGIALPTLQAPELPPYWLLMLVLSTTALVMAMQLDRARGRRTSSIDWLILASAWALSLGAVIQPYDWPHQTLQFVPFLILAVGRLVAAVPQHQAVTAVPLIAASLSLLYVFATSTLPQYDWRRQAADEAAITDAVASIPGIEAKSVWTPSFQAYVHWRLDKPPLTPISTHPPLLWDPGAQTAWFGAPMTTLEAMQKALALAPDVIVAEDGFTPPWGDADSDRYWVEALNRDYRRVAEVGDRVIWERRAPQGNAT